MSERPPLRIAALEIDGTVTRPLHLDRPFGETLLRALREAMLKRGCLRDRAHKGHCLDCALLPQCAVWPLVAPADPTRRQRGAYLRPFVLRVPSLASRHLSVGTRLTWGVTLVQDARFPATWGAFAAAFGDAARQLAEWGIGAPVRMGGEASRRGALSVGRVRWVHPLTGATEPYTPAETLDVPPPFTATWGDTNAGTPAPPNTVRLTFLTPTRLVVAGKSARTAEPGLLVRRIAERLDAVADATSTEPPNLLGDSAPLDAAGRLTLAKDETRWEGDPARGGFIGAVALSGTADDLAAVLPVLHWGAALGVGKGTLEGAGRFVVGGVPVTAPGAPANQTTPNRAEMQPTKTRRTSGQAKRSAPRPDRRRDERH
jgi:hypothetical protein